MENEIGYRHHSKWNDEIKLGSIKYLCRSKNILCFGIPYQERARMAETHEKRIGLVGLGIMGSAMALRLLERGWKLTVWNLEPERLTPIVAAGAEAAASPEAVARASDIVLMCVLHTAAVEGCVFVPGGLAGDGVAGKILIDHSTIDPEATRQFAARLAQETGMRWIDAPVSGGPLAARAGTLTVMAGGDEADIAGVQAVERDLAGNFTRMGAIGAGQTAKIVSQLIVGSTYVVLAEALSLAEAAGIDAKRLPECFAGGHPDSVLLQQVYVQMQARAFDPPRSYARQLLKDMRAIEEFAHARGLSLPMIETATARYAAYVADGHGMADAASILTTYRRAPG
jgi:3-hydroxyisobutyrate dehydrogenase